MNNITICGNLTADAVLRYTSSQVPIVSCRVAVFNRYDANGQELTDFFNVAIWGDRDVPDRSAFLADKLLKGTKVVFSGAIHSREYLDRNGNKQTSWEVTAYQYDFVSPKPAAEPTEQLAEDPSKEVSDAFQELYDDDGDLPFA